jgi:hypothetical protein
MDIYIYIYINIRTDFGGFQLVAQWWLSAPVAVTLVLKSTVVFTEQEPRPLN